LKTESQRPLSRDLAKSTFVMISVHSIFKRDDWMDSRFQLLRAAVSGPHVPTPWAQKIHEALQFVAAHPEFAPAVGLVPSSIDGFLVNSHACAQFFGVKRNSLNRNFQEHGFRVDVGCNLASELAAKCPQLAGTERRWVKRVFALGAFGTASGAAEVAAATAYARLSRGCRVGAPCPEALAPPPWGPPAAAFSPPWDWPE
jgi:hypothetical protein